MTVKSGESNGTVEVTPSGIPVYYQSKPKRLYRIRNWVGGGNPISHLVEMAQSETRESNGWREIPSVTTVLGVLDKSGPLIWWAQSVGVDGVLELYRRKEITCGTFDGKHGLGWMGSDGWRPMDTKDVVGLLTLRKMTTNHVRDNAGDRGQAVHDALENWARKGHMPDPSIYPEEQEGYVRGLVAFLKDIYTAEPVGAEVLVASSEYGYAGRYDLRIRTNAEHDVVVRRTATKIRKRTLKPGLLLADLKTSKSIYASHALQLAAYEQASIESGYEPTDGRGVLLVNNDGHYEFRRTNAAAEDFNAVLEVYNRMQNKKEWL